MNYIEIISQVFGILGFVFVVLSFQEKTNKGFFVKQALGGLMFFGNFIMLGAISGALFNFTGLVRGALFAKKRKVWHLYVVISLFTASFVFSLWFVSGDILQILLSTLTYVSLVVMSVFMWKGNGKHIRYAQLFASSPAWLIHNVFNFSLGGVLCEVFNITSVIISFIRFGKDGFEKE